MEKETRYGVRKLSVGVASVAVGTVVAGADVVHAEEADMPIDQSDATSEITDKVTTEAESLSKLQFMEENQQEESNENVNVYSGGQI